MTLDQNAALFDVFYAEQHNRLSQLGWTLGWTVSSCSPHAVEASFPRGSLPHPEPHRKSCHREPEKQRTGEPAPIDHDLYLVSPLKHQVTRSCLKHNVGSGSIQSRFILGLLQEKQAWVMMMVGQDACREADVYYDEFIHLQSIPSCSHLIDAAQQSLCHCSFKLEVRF